MNDFHHPAPAIRESIRPFGEILIEIVIPDAHLSDWDRSDRKQNNRTAARIESAAAARSGHPIHRAILVQGLKVAAYCYQQAVARAPLKSRGSQSASLEAAFVLLRTIEQHWGVYDLNLIIS